MMMAWPSALPALSAIERMTTSVEPPAGQGQMYLIVLDGYAGDCAHEGRATLAADADATDMKRRRDGYRLDMVVSSWVVVAAF
jgi:hypothetical protein